ncbi:sensor histidine kinase [Halorubrum lipolyticum]|uniref:histidine kinase n=1 Tax=Halorubrum lipolyticum DSM 21995 TaxID=1227482 RepID=M0NJE6_9EURY|nr:PAS domain-containing sensor histidine kinase [Halorubrum lipolyticum]EMA57234.1 histidine kinase [Halorubrum lipolyticum DSM 21995]
MERRPGVAYRRPDGDPTRLVVEAAGESRLDPESLPRSDWLRVVESADRDRLRDALDEGAVDVTYRLAVDGDPEWVHERGARDESGDVVGYLFPADDRVERRRQLEQQRERLEEFASVVSHDLRNPLSVAVGNIELARDFDGEAAAERLDRAHGALDYMDDLISDLLALAREGRSVEETATADLRSVVDRAWRTIGTPEGVVLVVDDPLPPVECDRSRLRQALENLFRNAVEHGAPDAVSVAAVERDAGGPTDSIDPETFGGSETDRSGSEGPALETGSADSGTVTDPDPSLRVFVGRQPDGFYVADDGGGIDPSERDAVFDPGHSSDRDGTGFGLSIVERIAEAHGWEVSVTESRAGGARFEFTGVDLVEAEGAEAEGAEAADAAPSESDAASESGEVGSRGESETAPGE